MRRGVAILDKPTASHGAGSDDRGEASPISGTVQAVEKGHTQYPDYPLRITMKQTRTPSLPLIWPSGWARPRRPTARRAIFGWSAAGRNDSPA